MKNFYFDKKKVYKYLSETSIDITETIVSNRQIDFSIYDEENDDKNKYWLSISRQGQLEIALDLENKSVKNLAEIITWINSTIGNCIYEGEETDQ